MCIHLVIAIRINSLQFNPSLLEKGLSRPTQIEMTTCCRFFTRLQDNVFVSTFRLIPGSSLNSLNLMLHDLNQMKIKVCYPK